MNKAKANRLKGVAISLYLVLTGPYLDAMFSLPPHHTAKALMNWTEFCKGQRRWRIGPAEDAAGLGLVQPGQGMVSEALTVSTSGEEITELQLGSSELFIAGGQETADIN